MLIQVPEFSLVVLIGCSGSGKSTFAAQHFPEETIVSIESCRKMISARDLDPLASHDASQLMQTIVSLRLKRRLPTVADAWHLTAEARRPLIELARRYHTRLVAILFDIPLEECFSHQKIDADSAPSESTLVRQFKSLQNQRRSLTHEGFHEIYTLHTFAEIKRAHVSWIKPSFDQRAVQGPFDIIGDVHGCADELIELVERLGYQVHETSKGPLVSHPSGRQLVFVGDLVDRGPAIVKVLQLVMNTVRAGRGWCVIGNHENKLMRYLSGRKVKISHGLEHTIQQLDVCPQNFRDELFSFFSQLSDHLILDEEKLVVVHAGIREEYIGRSSGEIRSFCLYGETNGELDAYGLPVRLPWAQNYFGQALVVYGHTPVTEATWVHHTINIDTGCVYGGTLSALRYPEREVVSVQAHAAYCAPSRPFRTGLPIPRPVPVRPRNLPLSEKESS